MGTYRHRIAAKNPGAGGREILCLRDRQPSAHDAIKRVAEAIAKRKTRVLDFDLRAYFDNVRHDRLLKKVAQRVDDKDIMHLLKLMLKASGKKGVPQGGVISPLLSNLYLNE